MKRDAVCEEGYYDNNHSFCVLPCEGTKQTLGGPPPLVLPGVQRTPSRCPWGFRLSRLVRSNLAMRSAPACTRCYQSRALALTLGACSDLAEQHRSCPRNLCDCPQVAGGTLDYIHHCFGCYCDDPVQANMEAQQRRCLPKTRERHMSTSPSSQNNCVLSPQKRVFHGNLSQEKSVRTGLLPDKSSGCGFFAYSWKLPAYSGAFFTYNLVFLLAAGALLLTVLASLLTVGASVLTVGKSV